MKELENVELLAKLSKMKLPSYRTDKLNKNNLEWISKNLAKLNSEHKHFNAVLTEVNKRLNEKEYEN